LQLAFFRFGWFGGKSDASWKATVYLKTILWLVRKMASSRHVWVFLERLSHSSKELALTPVSSDCST
jgi:hypothetical protein